MEDMVLLTKISESSIVDNLKKRFLDDYIYVSSGLRHICCVIVCLFVCFVVFEVCFPELLRHTCYKQ